MNFTIRSAARFTNKNGKPSLRLVGTLPDGTEAVIHSSIKTEVAEGKTKSGAQVTRENLESNPDVPKGLSASELVAALPGKTVQVGEEPDRQEGGDQWRLVGNGPEDDPSLDF